MECRRSLVVALGLALGVALGSMGCVATPTRPGSSGQPAEIGVQHVVKKEADGPKRSPKAATVTSLAEHREAEAAKCKDPQAQTKTRDAARKHYQEALQIDAMYLPAWLGLARVYRDLGDYDRALETYRKALEKHPREVGVWVDLGMCQARKKDFDQAIASLLKAVELDPENRQAMQTLGFCLARAGRFDDSVVYLSKTMDQANAHLHVARMAQHLHEKGTIAPRAADDLCRRHLQLALQANPSLAAARDMLSQLDGALPRTDAVVPAFIGEIE